MYKDLIQARTLTKAVALLLLSSAGTLISPLASADEGGVSFCLPRQFGSMAAVPGDLGWSIPLIYYHSSVEADRSAEIATANRLECLAYTGIAALSRFGK